MFFSNSYFINTPSTYTHSFFKQLFHQ